MKDDLDSKTLTVSYKYLGELLDLSGLKLLMVLNNKRIFYGEDLSEVRNVAVKSFTSMHWLPVSPASPQETMVTFAREQLYYAQEEKDRLMGTKLKSDTFLAVRDSNILTMPFSEAATKTNTFAQVQFQISPDLYIESPILSKNLIDSATLAGGIFILLTTVVGYLFSCFVPYFMHLYVIRKLFKVD